LKRGDPGELSVLHKCDVKLCGNPKHLFLGSPRDNWADSVAKGRQQFVLPGEGNIGAKLTTKEVLAIRRSSARVAELVRQYGVTDSSIRSIQLRQTWKHVPDDAQTEELEMAD
jgi:hypothetical protein